MTDSAAARRALMAWRRERRAALLAARLALPSAEHRAASRAILEHLRSIIELVGPKVLGAYWPIRQEFNPLPLLREQLAKGVTVALPVIRAKGQALDFRSWHPGSHMAIGVYDIPYPDDGAEVLPDTLLVAMVGFDAAGYRLGYGGGFYDRTAAAITPRPRLIGIAFEVTRMDSFQPLPHDIPMDWVVTEHSAWQRESADAPR